MSMADCTVGFVICASFVHTSCRWIGCLADVDMKARPQPLDTLVIV